MLTFTLDTNCLIDVEEDRPGASAVRSLADAHDKGIADVAVVAIAASERQKDGKQLEQFSEFESRLASAGLEHLAIINPLLYLGIGFWDRALWADDAAVVLERAIHDVLFPEMAFPIENIDQGENALRKWRNAKCDVQTFWAHLHADRDVFVSSDDNFHKETKKPRLIALAGRAIRILTPMEAAALLKGQIGEGPGG